MKRISMMGLSLVAAFALSALVAGGALAAKHVNSGPLKYKSTSGIAFLEVEGGGKIECKVSNATGEYTTSTSGTVTATFESCETIGKKMHQRRTGQWHDRDEAARDRNRIHLRQNCGRERLQTCLG
jgi:hypothetical protein